MSIAADTGTSSNDTTGRRGSQKSSEDDLTQLKIDLLKAEVRLAKARAGVAGAEADVKVLTARLKACTK